MGLEISKDSKQLIIRKGFYNILHKAYLETNQIDSSKYFSRLYTTVSKSLDSTRHAGLNSTFERQNELNELDRKTSIKKIIVIGLSILMIISVLSVYYIRKSRKRLHQKYEDLKIKINQLTTDKTIEASTSALENKEESAKDGIYIPDETVAVLLKKLDKFERSAKYIKKNITLGSMATDLDTNTRYISELIKEYRGKNFNNYINGLRIAFITEKLYHDPQFRKYKVAYLAEYTGFASGTSFTTIFKKETGMTPSYFISQLEKED